MEHFEGQAAVEGEAVPAGDRVCHAGRSADQFVEPGYGPLPALEADILEPRPFGFVDQYAAARCALDRGCCSDVVGMGMGEEQGGDLAQVTADFTQPGCNESLRGGHAGIDQPDLSVAQHRVEIHEPIESPIGRDGNRKGSAEGVDLGGDLQGFVPGRAAYLVTEGQTRGIIRRFAYGCEREIKSPVAKGAEMAIPATSEKTGQQPGRSPEFDRKLARDCNIPEDCSVPNSGELRSKLCRVRLRSKFWRIRL